MSSQAWILSAAMILGSAALAADELPVTDPTAPPRNVNVGSVTAGGDPLLLQATHVSPESRSALINDRVVAVGSRIQGAVVTAIETRRVTLQRGSESIVLRLMIPAVKQPAKDAP